MSRLSFAGHAALGLAVALLTWLFLVAVSDWLPPTTSPGLGSEHAGATSTTSDGVGR